MKIHEIPIHLSVLWKYIITRKALNFFSVSVVQVPSILKLILFVNALSPSWQSPKIIQCSHFQETQAYLGSTCDGDGITYDVHVLLPLDSIFSVPAFSGYPPESTQMLHTDIWEG